MKIKIQSKKLQKYLIILLFLLTNITLFPEANNKKKILTFNDIMKFREAGKISFSGDGKWLVLEANPDRGDGEAHIYNCDTGKTIVIERGGAPVLSKNGLWTAMKLRPGIAEIYKNKKGKVKPGCVLVNNKTGEKTIFSQVKNFGFTSDSTLFLLLKFREKKKEDTAGGKKKRKKEDDGKKIPETDLIVINLKTKGRSLYDFCDNFSIDPYAGNLVFSQYNKKDSSYSLNIIEAKGYSGSPFLLRKAHDKYFSGFSWSKKGSMLAVSMHSSKNNSEVVDSGEVLIINANNKKITSVITNKNFKKKWIIPKKSRLLWSKNNYQLFVGFKPLNEAKFYKDSKKIDKKIPPEKYYSSEEILKRKELDVWHWNDPLINPNQKKMWSRNKKRDYLWIFDIRKKRLTKLADTGMETIRFNGNGKYATGLSSIPYQKEMTWDGRYRDIYSVDLRTGKRHLVAKKVRNAYPQLSPRGKYILFFNKGHWHLFNTRSGKNINITADLSIPFYNEDNDYPQPAPTYGIAGWIKNDKGVFINDKYDIWQFTFGKKPENITSGTGREKKITFRIIRTDPDKEDIDTDMEVMLTAYSHINKDKVIIKLDIAKRKFKDLPVMRKKTYRFIGKAKKSDRIFITREDLAEFPDLIVTDTEFSFKKKITNLNPQVKKFRWGKADLIRWNSVDGIPLDGVIITPEDYNGEKRLPVLVYYYRFFSQRIYHFNQMKINHRPNFPFYASNGYAVFLPDIRFEIGRPGFSATKCLVPGVQKLIDMGIADPKAIALHGHSWSGYQTAFVITQTNIFSCAIAGAPVSNMTSAYGGIRWKTGLARQFQYERSQSRLGVSLWENITPYIENSPLFFANRIKTPLLIQFGDNDGAVPWYQGIELYLAMRRLGKPCIFLQYRGEPHHLQKYPDKLDYSIKFKEYLDHYLMGAPAPEWITRGILYHK